jgi:hypothetical protein
VFRRKSRGDGNAVQARLHSQSEVAFREAISAISKAGDRAPNPSIRAYIFDFWKHLENSFPAPSLFLENIPEQSSLRYRALGREVFREVDPLVRDLERKSDETTLPRLTEAFERSLARILGQSTESDEWLNLDKPIGSALAGLLALRARGLKKVTRNPEVFEAFGVLTVVVTWIMDSWLASDQRETARLNPD